MISKTNNNISDLKKEKQIKLRKKDLKMPINVSLTLILKVFTKKLKNHFGDILLTNLK